MAKKRKHRIVVEMTTNKPLTEAEAVWALRDTLTTVDIGARPVWPALTKDEVYIDKLTAKSFSRVIRDW